MRSLALAILVCAPALALAGNATVRPQPPAPTLRGVIADPTGAIIPNAEIDLVDAGGAVDGKFQSGTDGSFQVVAPHAGDYTLVVSQAGFKTVTAQVTISAPAASPVTGQAAVKPASLRIVLPIAPAATNVVVSADSSQDLTATDDNHDSSVMTQQDLKALPIFDNDFVSAMGSFLDSDVEATGGTGIMVDGV